jgi:hypothetical protein
MGQMVKFLSVLLNRQVENYMAGSVGPDGGGSLAKVNYGNGPSVVQFFGVLAVCR